jgi:hypothetical protein
MGEALLSATGLTVCVLLELIAERTTLAPYKRDKKINLILASA